VSSSRGIEDAERAMRRDFGAELCLDDEDDDLRVFGWDLLPDLRRLADATGGDGPIGQ
jgi:hypothetical protein